MRRITGRDPTCSASGFYAGRMCLFPVSPTEPVAHRAARRLLRRARRRFPTPGAYRPATADPGQLRRRPPACSCCSRGRRHAARLRRPAGACRRTDAGRPSARGQAPLRRARRAAGAGLGRRCWPSSRSTPRPPVRRRSCSTPTGPRGGRGAVPLQRLREHPALQRQPERHRLVPQDRSTEPSGLRPAAVSGRPVRSSTGRWPRSLCTTSTGGLADRTRMIVRPQFAWFSPSQRQSGASNTCRTNQPITKLWVISRSCRSLTPGSGTR